MSIQEKFECFREKKVRGKLLIRLRRHAQDAIFICISKMADNCDSFGAFIHSIDKIFYDACECSTHSSDLHVSPKRQTKRRENSRMNEVENNKHFRLSALLCVFAEKSSTPDRRNSKQNFLFIRTHRIQRGDSFKRKLSGGKR